MTLTFNHILVPLQLCFYEKSPNYKFLFNELEILLFQDFPGALRAPGCLQSKTCKIQKCTHLGPSLTLPIRNTSKFQLFSDLQIILLFPEFPGALWAPGCHQSKICKIQKGTHLGPSLTMFFWKKSKFNFLFSNFEIILLFQVFPRARRALEKTWKSRTISKLPNKKLEF